MAYRDTLSNGWWEARRFGRPPPAIGGFVQITPPTPLLLGFSRLRSALFTAESFLIPMAQAIATKKAPNFPLKSASLFLAMQQAMGKLLREDAQNISKGYYPSSVLFASEPTAQPLAHIQRLPRIFRDAMQASRRRASNRTKEFSDQARAQSRKSNLPEYYQRNFHFQTDGYLGEESAALYDHQVEILFAGTADPMRRLLLAPLKRHFSASEGRGLRILELGCGTGSLTNFLRLAFPQAEIVAVDLSEPYLAVARERVPGATFAEAKAESLPFAEASFDAVVSCFLFHELPLEIRRSVLSESARVLKPEGMVALVDSLQLGDNPSLDEPLKNFPVHFHEPFYANYARNPMEGLLGDAGLESVERKLGFFSKMIAAVKVPAKEEPPKKPKKKSVTHGLKAKTAGEKKARPLRPPFKPVKTRRKA